MRIRTLLLIPSLVLGTVVVLSAQLPGPVPSPVEKRGLEVEIRDLVRLPDTRGIRPLDQDVSPAGWARISFIRDLPDGRRFVNDSRGLLYLLDRPTKRVLAMAAPPRGAGDLTDVPEGIARPQNA